MSSTQALLKAVNQAKAEINLATTEQKNYLLNQMAQALLDHQNEILLANQADISANQDQISSVMLDRLRLTPERVLAMAQSIREVALLEDPVGKVLATQHLGNGLQIDQVSVPLGVIAIIYESRPNVTSDAATLALKSGNAVILRSGKEAFASAQAIVHALREGIQSAGFNPDILQLVTDTSRASAQELMTAVGMVDLLIPRGGAGLIKAVIENATVPCIETGSGICHIYVDQFADLDKAIKILDNAKTSRPSVCNAVEVCLVHEAIAAYFLPLVYQRLVTERREQGLQSVELRLDKLASTYITGTPVAPTDFDTEYNDYILAIGIVPDVDTAIQHINQHSSHHSEAIITEDAKIAKQFSQAVDSAVVYINASTRFTDGGEFGFGCEVGISTQKLHARGPMGLSALTTYKYIIRGDGQIRV